MVPLFENHSPRPCITQHRKTFIASCFAELTHADDSVAGSRALERLPKNIAVLKIVGNDDLDATDWLDFVVAASRTLGWDAQILSCWRHFWEIFVSFCVRYVDCCIYGVFKEMWDQTEVDFACKLGWVWPVGLTPKAWKWGKTLDCLYWGLHFTKALPSIITIQ